MRTLSLALLVLAACGPTLPSPPPASALDRAEAQAFGEHFAELLTRCDVDALGAAVDVTTFGLRMLDGVALDDAKKAAVLSAFKMETLWGPMCGLLRQGHVRATLLRVVEVDGAPRPLVRLLSDGSANYLELEVARIDGQPKLVDYVTYSNAQHATDSMRVGIAASLSDPDPFRADALERFSKCATAGDEACARVAYEDVPEEARQSPRMFTMELLFARKDPAKLLALIERFEKVHPGDPKLRFLSIDAHILRKEWPQALAAVDQLDQLVHDPFLDSRRANIELQAGHLDASRRYAERLVATEPELVQGHIARWWVSMSQRDFAAAVASLKVLHERFDRDPSRAEIAKLVGGRELLASPQYQAWRGPD